MTPYRVRLLAALEDGAWHHAAELPHPQYSVLGLEAWVRILRVSGYRIEQDGEGRSARYRLVDTPPTAGER